MANTPAQNAAMVRTLYVAIAMMTLAIAFMLGAIVGRLLTPSAAPPPDGEIDFAVAPVVSVAIPPGSRVLDIDLSLDRVSINVQAESGDRAVLTAPLNGYERPVQLRIDAAP